MVGGLKWKPLSFCSAPTAKEKVASCCCCFRSYSRFGVAAVLRIFAHTATQFQQMEMLKLRGWN
jgi:hypothetical protein